MKKALLILLMLASLTSVAQQLLLTEDTTLQGDHFYSVVRTNGYNLDIADGGSLSVSSFIMLNKGNQATGGTITAVNINVGSNVFFFSDGGTLKSTGSITIGNDVKGIGTIVYCTNFSTFFIDESVQVIQDCTLSLPLEEYVKSLRLGEPYLIYNFSGQLLRKGNLQSHLDIYATKPQLIVFPRKHYRAKMKLMQ